MSDCATCHDEGHTYNRGGVVVPCPDCDRGLLERIGAVEQALGATSSALRSLADHLERRGGVL